MGVEHIDDMSQNTTDLVIVKYEDMLETKVNHIGDRTSLRHSGKTTGIDESSLKGFDYKHIDYKVKKLSGIKVLQATKVQSNQKLTIEVKNELSRGNLKIIIVSPDNTLVDTIDVNSNKVIEIKHTIEGIYRVVVGSESAEFSIVINRSIS